MVYGERKDPRVRFEKPISAAMIGVDGTWRRDCGITDISASGAKLILGAPVAGLSINEFFLLLTPSGSAYRRCILVRVEGETIGVRFVASSPRRAARRSFLVDEINSPGETVHVRRRRQRRPVLDGRRRRSGHRRRRSGCARRRP